MTDCATVRTLALALPEAEEHNHRGRPAFRVRGKIFATLWPDEGRMVVKLPPAEQAALAALAPQLFAPVPGGWGGAGLDECIPCACSLHRYSARAAHGMASGCAATAGICTCPGY